MATNQGVKAGNVRQLAITLGIIIGLTLTAWGIVQGWMLITGSGAVLFGWWLRELVRLAARR